MATNNTINYDIPTRAATFSAYRSALMAGVVGNVVISPFPFDATTINENSVYNAGTRAFTAPVSGNYIFNCSLGFSNIEVVAPAATTCQITLIQGADQHNRTYCQPYAFSSGGTCIINGHFLIALAAGNTVYISVTFIGESGNVTNILADVTTFSGYLIF